LGLLQRLFGSPNPTRGWTRDPSRALELNLDSDSLSGVRLGDSFDHLGFLGPARRSTSDPELWEFVLPGVLAEASDGRIESLFVVPIPDEHFGVEPYTGTVTKGGQRVPIAQLEGVQEVVRAFGAPARQDADDEEMILFYDAGGVQRQIELTPQGRIKTIAIFSPP